MPMPHRTQMQLIKRRLVGKDGSERVRELRAILGELPGYKNGPYADIRKWVESQLEHTRVQKRDGAALRAAFPGPQVVEVTVLDDASVERLRETIWELTGLMRVYLWEGEHPIALHPPATVLDVADAIHHHLGARCTGARIWGPSARFDGQQVGRAHELEDGDTVEVLD
jgi:ribosome-interacting GTPase 1